MYLENSNVQNCKMFRTAYHPLFSAGAPRIFLHTLARSLGFSSFIIPTHIAQNIAETCQAYFQYFIAIEILSQLFCQILQNISSQHYNFKNSEIFLRTKWIFNTFRNIVERFRRNVPILHISIIFPKVANDDETLFLYIIGISKMLF